MATRLSLRSLRYVTRGLSAYSTTALQELKEDFEPFSKEVSVQHYLWDLEEADKIVDKFKNVQDSLVFELSSGPALLSQAFLRAGTPKTFCVEPNSFFRRSLSKLKREYPKRFFPLLHQGGQFWHPLLIDGVFPCQDLEQYRTEWTSEKLFARIFSLRVLKDNQELGDLLLSIHFQYGLFAFGRCETLLLFSKELMDKFFLPRRLSGLHVTLKLLFDSKVVHQMENTSFYPCLKRKRKSFYLVSFTPKKYTGIKVHDNERSEIQDIHNLMKHLYRRPNQDLESHFHDLGGDDFLEKTGLSKYLKPKELTDQELVQLLNVHFEWKDNLSVSLDWDL